MDIKKLIPLLLIAVVFIAAKSDERSKGWFGSGTTESASTSSSSYGNYGTSSTASTASASKTTAKNAAADEEPADAQANALSVLAKNPEAIKSLLSLAKAMEQGNTQPASETTPKASTTTAQKSSWR